MKTIKLFIQFNKGQFQILLTLIFIYFFATFNFNSKVNLESLEQKLSAGKLELADEETRKAMVKIISNQSDFYIWMMEKTRMRAYEPIDIVNLSCDKIDEINNIDKLWMNYSKNKFGFTPQKQIIESKKIYSKFLSDKMLLEYKSLAFEVGWTKDRGKIPYRSTPIKFSLQSPKGHLPSWGWIDSPDYSFLYQKQDQLNYSYLFEKINVCHDKP